MESKKKEKSRDPRVTTELKTRTNAGMATFDPPGLCG